MTEKEVSVMQALTRSQKSFEKPKARSTESKNSTSTSSDAGNINKGFDPCSICLESVKRDEAYLDRCFHSFCYHCISQWSRVIANKHSLPLSFIKCPLCKIENFSVIHGFNGELFQRDYINKDLGNRCLSSIHEFRLKFYNSEAAIRNNAINVERYWKSHSYLQKNIWLQGWLRREIQALIQEEDVDVIVHHILGVVDSFSGRKERGGIKGELEQRRREFRALLSDAARPFLASLTERFVDEVELFLASGLNIKAYDKVCVRFLDPPPSFATTEGGDEGCHDWRDRYLYYLGEEPQGTD